MPIPVVIALNSITKIFDFQAIYVLLPWHTSQNHMIKLSKTVYCLLIEKIMTVLFKKTKYSDLIDQSWHKKYGFTMCMESNIDAMQYILFS